jgi:hypothetical protein
MKKITSKNFDFKQLRPFVPLFIYVRIRSTKYITIHGHNSLSWVGHTCADELHLQRLEVEDGIFRPRDMRCLIVGLP